MGEEFRTGLEIVYEEILGLLELLGRTDLYVVFDSWYYSSNFIGKIKDRSHEVICKLKSKKIVINEEEMEVSDFAENLDHDEISIKVREEEKKYSPQSSESKSLG